MIKFLRDFLLLSKRHRTVSVFVLTLFLMLITDRIAAQTYLGNDGRGNPNSFVNFYAASISSGANAGRADVTQEKTPQTITFHTLAAKTYGSADFAPGATASSSLTVNYTSSDPSVATIVDNRIHIVGHGTTNITASQVGNATYDPAVDVVQSLTVDKAVLTITAAAITKLYGDTDPEFTYTTTGLVGNDAPIGKLERASPNTNKFIGNYAIEQGTLSFGNNYSIIYVGARLTINKRPITISPVSRSKVYGSEDPYLNSFFIAAGSLPPGDATGGAFGRAPGENVGSYLMTLGAKKFYSGGTVDGTENYDITVLPSYFIISPKSIDLTVNPATKAFGDADPEFTYTVPSGVTNAKFTGKLSRTSGEDLGKYAIKRGTLQIDSNYTFNLISDSLTIGRKALILTPNPATKVYGNTDPVYTFTTNVPIVGNAAFTGIPVREEGKSIGTYAITGLGTLALDNPRYELGLAAGGSLTITKRPITLQPEPATKTYGSTDPTFPYRFMNGTSVAPGEAMAGPFGRAPGEDVGTYALTLGNKSPFDLSANSYSKDNYDITFISANLTITPKRVDISAANLSKPFGDSDPVLTYTIDQTLVGNDAATGILSRSTGEDRGSYTITQGTLSLGNNYQIYFNTGTFTIGQKTIDVAPNIQHKVYGATDPELTFTASATPVGESFTGTLSRVAGENVGTYPISRGTLSLSDNYVINFIGNNFNINKAILTYIANPVSRPFKNANPLLSGTVTGFANGETLETVTTGELQFSSTASLNSPIGSYAITGSGLAADNYSFAQHPANNSAFEVTASEDNTLSSLSVSIGNMNPAFNPEVLNYSASVENNITKVDFSAILNSEFATATLKGVPYVPGSTQTLSLTAGANEFDVVVTAQNKDVKTYRIAIHRAYSTNNLLKNLIVNAVTLTPEFDPEVTTYYAKVPYNTSAIGMYGVPADSTATVKGYDGTVASAENPSFYPLSIGEYAYNLTVTSQSGANRYYTIVIDRAQSSDASLTSFGSDLVTLNTPVAAGTLNYSGTVAHNVENTRFKPVSAQGATIQVLVNDQRVDNFDGYFMAFGFGVNNLKVLVTSADGSTTSTYNLDVTRAKSNDARLGSLVVPFQTNLNESFNPDVYNYTANLADSTITGLPVTANSANEFALVKINGTVVPRYENYEMALHGGANTFNIVVTSQDGLETKTYKLVVSRAGQAPPAKSPNARLLALNVSSGSFSKNFNLSYDELTPITVANNISSLNLFLYSEHGGATATVNGKTVPSLSTQEYNITGLDLQVGQNLLNILMTAEDGVVTQAYPVQVTRLPYVNVDLASLSIDKGVLNPVFSPAVTNYTFQVASNVGSIAITPVAANSSTTLTVNGDTINALNPTATVAIQPGIINRIRIVARAADGVNTKTYTLNITRQSSFTDANLETLVTSSPISPAFSSDVTNYTSTVASSVATFSLSPVAKHSTATVTVNGAPLTAGAASVSLANGTNSIAIKVVAEDGETTKTYSLSISRSASNVATANLSINPATKLERTTGAGYKNYVTAVAMNATSIKLKVTPTDMGAKLTIDGNPARLGVDSTISLVSASKMINILVTAANGVTKRTYTLLVKRTGRDVATANVSVSPSNKLDRSTGAGYRNYIASVAMNATSVSVRPTLTDTNATVTINGVSGTSGVYSTVPLTGQTTMINVVVTAENGVTQKSYDILVKREGRDIATASVSVSPSNKLIRSTGTGYRNYIASVAMNATSVTVRPTLTDMNASVTINGNPATSGVYSTVSLTGPSTMIYVVVTAEDGITQKSYNVLVQREGRDIAMASLSVSPSTKLIRTTGVGYRNYTTTVAMNTTSIAVRPTLSDANARVAINGSPASSGVYLPVPLTGSSTMIDVVVTAENGVTTKTYKLLVKKPESNVIMSNRVDDQRLTETSLSINAGDGNASTAVVVHQGLSPNGDGLNDYLKIDGLETFADNNITIINSKGGLVFKTTGYGTNGNVFDGRSNNGTLQIPGTYYYILEYKKGKTKERKTGYIILKY